MSKNNIYSFYPEFIEAIGFKQLVSVYIPSIHCDYDTTTISFVFQRLFGTVYRIDSVYNEEKPNFKSVFVYYYENNYFNEKRQPFTGNKVFPSHYVQNRQIFRVSPIKPNEYWLIFENKTMFPDTTMTLDEISAGFDEMKKILDSKEIKDQDEIDVLIENRSYLAELYTAENTPGFPYLDTNHNIHQLAQNLKLMRERLCEKEGDDELAKYAMPSSNTNWEGYDEPMNKDIGDDGYFTDDDATWGEHCRRLRNENPNLDEQHIDAIATYETYGTPNIIFKYTSYGKEQNC